MVLLGLDDALYLGSLINLQTEALGFKTFFVLLYGLSELDFFLL